MCLYMNANILDAQHFFERTMYGMKIMLYKYGIRLLLLISHQVSLYFIGTNLSNMKL